MDEQRVKLILTPYSPPLSSSQVESISAEIAKVFDDEIGRLKIGGKKSRKSKSQK